MRLRTAVTVGLLALGGCSLAPAPETPATVLELPEAYGAGPEGVEAESRFWWRSFDDPTLDRLVEAALEANLDVREAFARLRELRHRYRIARAPLFPAVDARGDVTRSSSPGNTGFGGSLGEGDGEGESGEGEPGDGEAPPDSVPGFRFPDRFEFTTWSASLGFAYELDFWGRLRNESSAAAHEFVASRADLETVRLGVIASTISTYLETVALRRELRLAEQNVDLLRERVELTDERYRRGLVGSFELYAIRQEYRTAEAGLPGLRIGLEDARGRLAVILGRYAGSLGDLLPAGSEPAVDLSPIPGGLPVTLLEARPDVIAAAERLEAARRRVGARRAERLPTISLNGSVGFQASDPEELFRADQWFLNLVGGLVAPLFQGGRLRANVGVAEARYEQLAVAYARTVLEAFREVRTSLARFDYERERYGAVLAQVADARASLDLQLRRFRRGVGDYVSYLDARRNLTGAESALARAERGVGEARLAVHRALGGAWVPPGDGMASDGPDSAGPMNR